MNSFETLAGFLSIATISSLFNQSFHGLRALNIGSSKQTYFFHRSYLKSKLIFIFMNLIRLAVNDKYDCTILNQDNDCKRKTQFNFAIDLLWSCVDLYFALIIYFFCRKVLRGDFESHGANLEEIEICKMGIIKEVFGKRFKGGSAWT